jgi:hypothetical protein
MTKMVSTKEIEVGSRIDLWDRAVIVAEVAEDGLRVIWYDDRMQGPYSAVLPHCSLYRTIYHDERLGEHESYHDVHPDFTGKTGEA